MTAAFSADVVTPSVRVTQHNINKVKTGKSIRIPFAGKYFISLLTFSAQGAENTSEVLYKFSEDELNPGADYPEPPSVLYR